MPGKTNDSATCSSRKKCSSNVLDVSVEKISKCLKYRVCCMCHFGISSIFSPPPNNAKRLHPFECSFIRSSVFIFPARFTYFFEMLHLETLNSCCTLAFRHSSASLLLAYSATNWATLKFIVNYINFSLKLTLGEREREREFVCGFAQVKIDLSHCISFYPLHLSIASLNMTSSTSKWNLSLYHLFSTRNKKEKHKYKNRSVKGMQNEKNE